MKRAREDEAESLVDQTVRAESSRAGAEKVNSVRQSSVAKDPGHSASDAGSSSHPWQAVWDENNRAWYFWNSQTNETTWQNPLENPTGAGNKEEKTKTSTENTTTEAVAAMTDDEVAVAAGIDPDLKFLDEGMYMTEVQNARTSMGGASSTPTNPSAYVASGAFSSRTGKFVPLSQTGSGGLHDPSRLTHAAQADRQMSAFFDIEAHQAQREADRRKKENDSHESNKRQRPTKKQLKFYKERAKEKKAAKLAWLRE